MSITFTGPVMQNAAVGGNLRALERWFRTGGDITLAAGAVADGLSSWLNTQHIDVEGVVVDDVADGIRSTAIKTPYEAVAQLVNGGRVTATELSAADIERLFDESHDDVTATRLRGLEHAVSGVVYLLAELQREQHLHQQNTFGRQLHAAAHGAPTC